ncbi:transcriptional regulator [Picrophilus oshimae]|uniref:Putative HTH-type transcriptional regulatory protein SAMN02745355_0438 n=1 Tax=Picrophilus torridus (strain ATCC 700027 / DSM 9790 / JCM 10055 / NBRC 100828 / KAW 2/3) TaxID=1122961 RepID=A0A8G2L737_PICTO|nr:transcriptional regulator [Picrophilus oshimae]SMD30550.1 putative transcriptional regulator [Picrophilus oshimae DSM 9789]
MDYRHDLIIKLYDALIKNGFNVSEPDLYGLVTFDLICRRNDEKYIIKVLYNIDTFSRLSISSLMAMASVTKSSIIVIGEKSGSGRLEDGILYYRHHIPIMSFKTFIDYINGESPYIYSAPGGYYVSIDGDKMRRIRELKGYSVGYLSSKLGISRRSISLYESGSSATIDIYLKLEETLGEDLTKDIDIRNEKYDYNIKDDIKDVFIRETFQMLSALGYSYEYIKKSPFDGFSYDPETMFMLGIFNNYMENERIISIKKISQVLNNIPLIIQKEYTEKENIYGCPVVSISELRSMGSMSAFKKLIEKRYSYD